MVEAIIKSEYTDLFRYIESNLPSDLDAALLSGVGYASRAKLYRGFYNLTGHSVKEYVRKRRLSNALALVKTSELGLTDIALRCGYSSHQALCRAVKQTLDMTPSDYKNGDTYYFFPPFKGEPLQSVTVSDGVIPRAVRALYYHPRMKNIENEAVGAFLAAFPDYNGRIFGRNGKQGNSRFCYELYLTDTDIEYSKLNTCGFKVADEVPGFTAMFATSTVRNEERKINAAWDYLYSAWLQNSMFEYTDEPYYEEYLLKNGKLSKLRLYLPIRKRATENKITLIPGPGLRFAAARAKGYGAERIASRAVVNYLARHPHITGAAREFYLRKEMNAYICGVRISPEAELTEDGNILDIRADQGNYLVLDSSVMGDYDRYADMLISFAEDNGMISDESGIFAVYDASESYENLRIRMYCPVKIDTN